MTGGSRSRELGDQLERLKVSSGRSYESIGQKIHLSKSAVHRYCTGASVPREFGVVERIALVCGATRDDMVLVHRLWLRATASPDSPDEVLRWCVLRPRPNLSSVHRRLRAPADAVDMSRQRDDSVWSPRT